MPESYVERRAGGYYIAGTRISLDSVVYAFLRGEPAEGIVDSFPVLSLEQVFGAPTCTPKRPSSSGSVRNRGGNTRRVTQSWMRRNAKQAGTPGANEG